jgi:hypothetical protein
MKPLLNWRRGRKILPIYPSDLEIPSFLQIEPYWRKEKARYDPSLSVRVNGRATYWSGGSNDKNRYINIPGGPAFENFELREKFFQGQKFYFGLSRKTPAEIIGQ